MTPTSFNNKSEALPRPLSSTRPTKRAGRSAVNLVLGLAMLAGVLVAVPTATAEAATASGSTGLVINGRGWGHGRGMGQYGALGYARDYGWTSAQILDHYYRGTTAGPAPSPGLVEPSAVRVDLRSLRNKATEVSLTAGTLRLVNAAGATIAETTGAVRLIWNGAGFNYWTGPTCGTDWVPAAAIAETTVKIQAIPPSVAPASEADGLLRVCGTSHTWYDGDVWATIGAGQQRTLNVVAVDAYLRGVVPREVPALWPAPTLEAQSVAARSYVLAGDTRWGDWADTCDTTLCQVYEGRYSTRRGSFAASTHPNTDAAIAATAGVVRLNGSGSVARTEFSSSTGGWTAGGDFAAVQDLGDAVSSNPNHRWRVTIDPAVLESRYDRGQLVGVAVTERSEAVPGGGRGEDVELRFTGGSVNVSGNRLRQVLGLRSDWFSIGTFTRNGQVQDPIDPELISSFVEQVHRRLAGQSPSADQRSRWSQGIDGGDRRALVEELVYGPDHAGVLLDELYRTVFGRSPDADGGAYWQQRLGEGLAYEYLGTFFFGSDEYVRRAGGDNAAFVDALYRDLMGRPADAAGRAYWIGQLDAGVTAPVVAHSFYRSVESRRTRAEALHRRVFDDAPTSAERQGLAQRLLTVDDLALTVDLALELDIEPDP
jgi:SpoIID/LytB domain protein